MMNYIRFDSKSAVKDDSNLALITRSRSVEFSVGLNILRIKVQQLFNSLDRFTLKGLSVTDESSYRRSEKLLCVIQKIKVKTEEQKMTLHHVSLQSADALCLDF